MNPLFMDTKVILFCHLRGRLDKVLIQTFIPFLYFLIMCGNFILFSHVLECKVFIALGEAICLGWILDILLRISSFDTFHEVEVTRELILDLNLGCDQICLIILT